MEENDFEASSRDLMNAICTTVGSGTGPERYVKVNSSVRLKCGHKSNLICSMDQDSVLVAYCQLGTIPPVAGKYECIIWNDIYV